ncbi:hypothetical protein B0H13DRAFT_1608656 [Mycena leptocephala]|nr:hypothetical protein B0H13DRAFT_1608656 [Mycena leptocephala]
MSRILIDPSLEVCPDYLSDTYRDIRIALTTADSTLDSDAAAKRLADAWIADRNLRNTAWDAQVQDDADQVARAEAEKEAEEEAARAASEAEAEAERKEAAKKKPKFPAFDKSAPAPDFLQPRPSNFAKHKVAALEYVELWYFTVEGCNDTDTIRTGAAAEDAFGLVQSDNLLELKPMSAYKASKRLVRDEDLTWSQMTVGATGLLKELEAAGWPVDYRSAFASYFYALNSHPYRLRGPAGEAVLLIYQGRVRRSFHDHIKEGRVFNISAINSTLLDSIQSEYNGRIQAEKLALVRLLVL